MLVCLRLAGAMDNVASNRVSFGTTPEMDLHDPGNGEPRRTHAVV